MIRRSVAGAISVPLLLATLAACTPSAEQPAPTSSASAPTSAAVPPPAPATTPVPPPTPGRTSSTVPSKKVIKRKPVKLDGSGQTADKVVVTLPTVKAITAKAKGPGEVSGPALAVTVQVANGSGSTLDLNTAVVTLTASDGTPGAIMAAPPAAVFPDEVAAGASARGTYVFALPKSKRSPVVIEVSTSPDVPLVVFRGSK